MRRSIWAVAAGLIALAAGEAQAQAQAPSALAPRAGPDRFPQALPPPTRTATAGVVSLADVRVTVEPARAGAPAPRDWTPLTDAATGLSLTLQPGERLDGPWLRRQFVDNGLVGAPVPLDRLVALAQLVNLAFIRHGLINSGVRLEGALPVDGGVLEVRMIFGRTASTEGEPVAVVFGPEGAKGLTPAYIRDRLPAAAAVPFNAQAVERQFRLLALDPAVRAVNADLRPGQAPGEAVLQVTVDPQPRFDVYATVANSRSPSIGGERYSAGGSIRNLVSAGDVFSGEYGRTGGRDDVTVGYETPLLSPRIVLSVRGGRDDAAVVEAALRPLGIRSRDWFVDGGLASKIVDTPLVPLEGGRIEPARTLTAGLRASHREQRTYLLGQPFSFSPGSVDGRSDYTAVRLTVNYTERGVRQVIALSATATLGLDGTRSDIPGVVGPRRDFKAILAQASYARRLAPSGLELRTRLAMQVADGPLYSGERFSAGGENSVRGYRENLLLADQGAFASLELAQPFDLDARSQGTAFRWGAFTASAFLDAARVNNRDGPDPAPESIASVGASLAWTPSEALLARVTYGEALKDVPVGGRRDIQDRGLSFRITVHPLALR